jgi:hypothetical protein
MKLSERIQSGENTPELREAIAVLAGWRKAGRQDRIQYPNYYGWIGPLPDAYLTEDAPDYLTNIGLTFADIDRRGWFHCSNGDGDGCEFVVWNGGDFFNEATRKDRDLSCCACEAYVKALENDDGK